MKTLLALTALLGLVAGATALSSSATELRDPAHPLSAAALATDDPPPFECPFCGGNPELHRARIVALEKVCASAALLVLP